jgi:hypothetical protein
VRIDANRIIESDPIAQPILPGGAIIVTTWYRNPNPEGALPFLNWALMTANGDGDAFHCAAAGQMPATILTDPTLLHAKPTVLKPLTAGQPQLIRAYYPIFIAGLPHPSYAGATPAPIFLGDSINVSQNDFSAISPDDHFGARGWNGRYCADKIPFVIYGQGGSNGAAFFSEQKGELFRYLFGDESGAGQKVTHLVDAYGINSIRDRHPGKTWQSIWRDRVERAKVAARLGIPVIETTLTPMVTRPGLLVISDKLPNTDPDFVAAEFTADWLKFNAEIRTAEQTIPGCLGFIDWSPAVATAPDKNEWKPGIAGDGIHPGAQGHQDMANVIPLDLFTR